MGILLTFFTLVSVVVHAQNLVLTLTVDKKDVHVDEHCTFTVTSNVEGTSRIDFPVDFAVDYGIMHGMEQKMDASGRVKTVYHMQQSGLFKKAGTYAFYATLTYQNKLVKSNKITIKVSEEAEDESITVRTQDPVFGMIQCEKTTVYEGEPVLLKAKVFSYMNIEFLENYVPFSGDINVEAHEFTNGRVEVENTKVNGKNALAFEYGKQLFFPIATGKCKVRPFEMALRCQGSIFSKTIRFRSAPLTLKVKALPSGAPADFIGGVGTFDLKQKLAVHEVKEGEVFTLELTVSGTGNLHNTNPPKLKLPKGFSLYGDPERQEDFDYTDEGVSGKIVYRYNIQVLEGHDLEVLAPSISYFDPHREKYVTVRGQAFTMDVIPDKSFEAPEDKPSEIAQSHTDATVNGQELQQSEKGKSSGTNWFLVIGAPVAGAVLLLVVLFRRKKEKPDETSGLEAMPVHFMDDDAKVEKTCQDYWQEAHDSMGDPAVFAVLFPKAIIQRVEKLERCAFQSREKAFESLHQKNNAVAMRLKELIQECDQYRYGFGGSELNTNALITEAEELFRRI